MVKPTRQSPKPGSGAMPEGSDPRIDIDDDELSAASQSAMPAVARKGGMSDALGLAAGIIGSTLIGAVTLIMLNNRTPEAPVQAAPPPSVQPLPSTSVLPPVDSGVQTMIDPAPQVLPPQPLPQPQPQPQAQPAPVAAASPTLVVDNSQGGAAEAASQAGAATQAQMLNANDQFAARMGQDAPQRAWRIGDPSNVISQGTVIPAVLETAINSDLPGYTRAIVSRDVRSFDGKTVLIPRGSRLIGQYKSGLASGETRAFIIWSRIIRPDGLTVQLTSPSTDELGQAGTSGKVDTHFVKRFGAAILLSIVNGLASGLSDSNSTIVIGSSSDARNVATEALSNSVKIPPTITVAPGTSIQVFAARDLDFSLK